MAILKYKTKDEIPEDLKKYVEEAKDGEDTIFKVDVAPQAKVKEFRDNNTAKAQELEKALDSVKKLRAILGLSDDAEFDADKLKEQLDDLRNTKKLVDDGKLEKKEDIERELEKRTEALRRTLEEAKQAALKAADEHKKRADENESKYRRTFIDKDVFTVCNDPDVGLESWAMQYILQDAYSLYQVEGDNNALVPKRDGSVVYGESGSDPMTIKEWVTGEVRRTKPHFFKKSGGGGADGGADVNKQFGGMSKEQFDKLPAGQRLAIANEIEAKNRAKASRR